MQWEILSDLVQWEIVLLQYLRKEIWILSHKLFFKETSTCQLVHFFAIIAFLAFNNVQKSQSNNDRCCLKEATVAIGR